MATRAHTSNAEPPSTLATVGPRGVLALCLAGLFGWVVTLPLFGPVGIQLAGERLAQLSGSFLLAHVPGLVLWGYLSDRFSRRMTLWVGLAVAAEAALTLALLFAPEPLWPALFAAMGLAAGCVAVWGRWYATTVPASWLGRTFALSAAGTNLVKWAFTVAGPHISSHTLLILLTLAPLGLAGVSLLFLERTTDPSRIPFSGPASAEGRRNRTLVRYGLFIVFFSVVAGLSYRFLDVAPITPLVKRDLALVTYMMAVLLSGHLADRRGLHIVAAAGSTLLAISFLIGAWGQPQAQYVSTALNGAAFGLLEPAPWLLLASRTRPESAGRWFGWGLNMNVVPIFIGAGLSPLLGHLSLERLALLAAVALLLATWSLHGATDPLAELHSALRGRIEADPAAPGYLPMPDDIAMAASPDDLAPPAELLRRRYGDVLSGRELEVGQLAISGMSTREIALAMYISENTVKTHLKNLYRKTQSSNRNDLYRRLVEGDREQTIDFAR